MGLLGLAGAVAYISLVTTHFLGGLGDIFINPWDNNDARKTFFNLFFQMHGEV